MCFGKSALLKCLRPASLGSFHQHLKTEVSKHKLLIEEQKERKNEEEEEEEEKQEKQPCPDQTENTSGQEQVQNIKK